MDAEWLPDRQAPERLLSSGCKPLELDPMVERETRRAMPTPRGATPEGAMSTLASQPRVALDRCTIAAGKLLPAIRALVDDRPVRKFSSRSVAVGQVADERLRDPERRHALRS